MGWVIKGGVGWVGHEGVGWGGVGWGVSCRVGWVKTQKIIIRRVSTIHEWI